MKRYLLLGLCILLAIILISLQTSLAQGPSDATQSVDATPTQPPLPMPGTMLPLPMPGTMLPPPPPGTLLPPPPTSTAPTRVPPTQQPSWTPVPSATSTPVSLYLTAPVVNILTDTDDYRCDNAQCSLRAALFNAASGATITFAPGLTGTLLLTPRQAALGKLKTDLTIKGPGAKVLTINGNHLTVGGFVVNAKVTMTISGLTFAEMVGPITNAAGSIIVSDCAFNDGWEAIRNLNGTAVITNTTFLRNQSSGGSGIFSAGTNAKVTVTNSTFQGNSNRAIETGRDGSFTIINSTFQGNSGGVAGGGQTTITNSTFQNNLVDIDGVGIVIKNTIIDDIGKPAYIKVCSGAITDGGNNLQFPGTDCGKSIPVSAPKLGHLQDNGGPTWTMALQPGSAALDAGDKQVCAASMPNHADQRGMVLPNDSPCDIGAFQHNGIAPSPLRISTPNARPTNNFF